jgi:hypothetical protein
MFCLVSSFSNNFTFVLTFCVALKILMVLINTLFTLCRCVTKRGGSIFCSFWFLDRDCISIPVKCFFVPEWLKVEFVSILCWLYSG